MTDTRAVPGRRTGGSLNLNRLVAVAAELPARRTRTSPDAPEPQIAATAPLGPWSIRFQSLGKHLDGVRSPEQVHEAVTADVRRAATLVDTGLAAFESLTEPTTRPATTARP
ncbi:hypothetical protein OHB54_05385 [Streptomyces sp. NBC_01007]|nr:hypothetical protein OHB54_05385 [Streptomyces sp. NBC_01007]